MKINKYIEQLNEKYGEICYKADKYLYEKQYKADTEKIIEEFNREQEEKNKICD